MLYPKIILTFSMLILLASCSTMANHTGHMGQSSSTQVELSEANFKILGSFSGIASTKKSVPNIKNKLGLMSLAKQDLLANAQKAGVEMTGSRAMIHITTDFTQNENRITCSMTAEIIEFQ